MTLEDYLTTEVKKQRQGRFERNDQLTLGQLIEKLEKASRMHDGTDKDEANVVFDFEYLFPVDFESWRGSYDELAITFSSSEHSGYELKAPSLGKFIELCKRTVGSVFTGYKGGEYRMDSYTPVWVANRGNSGNTALIDVVYDGYSAILVTGYRDF